MNVVTLTSLAILSYALSCPYSRWIRAVSTQSAALSLTVASVFHPKSAKVNLRKFIECRGANEQKVAHLKSLLIYDFIFAVKRRLALVLIKYLKLSHTARG